jgi:precorrin-4/cobalt-precorrin-4 C11-methyltransferase
LSPFYGESCPAAVVYHASWPDEQIFRGTLKNISQLVEEAGVKRTALILVGQAIARPEGVSKLYDATFSHGYRSSK